MNAAELLGRLRQLGIEAAETDGRLALRGRGRALPADLCQELQARRGEVLAKLAQERAGTPPECHCAGCGAIDYMPLGGGWRRCWACGARWGPGTDPGDPPDLNRISCLLAPPRVLVTGSRRWTDAAAVERELVFCRPGVVIAGGAPGADRLAAQIARRRGVEVQEYLADWRRHGRRAGVLRNLDMLREGDPSCVLAFHDDLSGSRGTAHMCGAALAAGLPVRLVGHDGDGELSVRELSRADLPRRDGVADLALGSERRETA